MANEFKNEVLTPVKKEYMNCTMKAPRGMKNCSDLHTYKGQGIILSVWKMESLWERIKFLFRGEISLSIYSARMPPVSLVSGELTGKGI